MTSLYSNYSDTACEQDTHYEWHIYDNTEYIPEKHQLLPNKPNSKSNLQMYWSFSQTENSNQISKTTA